MPEEQARILAETHTLLIEERLATRQDLKEMELRLKHDLTLLKHELTLRLGGMMAASVAVVAALVKLF